MFTGYSSDQAQGHHRRATGYVMAVQPGSFRLMTDAGEVLLLNLASGAQVARDLSELCYAGIRVMVDYDCGPTIGCGVARAVFC